MQQRPIRILGTGKYLPQRVLSAADIDEKLGVSPGWVAAKTGVLTRHFADGEPSSRMGAKAALAALEAANLTLDDIDCLVCASGTAEQGIPCTAALIQQALGLQDSGLPSFDIDSTCLSFLVALDTMSYLVAAGRYRRILIVSTDVASVGLDWEDKESAAIFGDAAAAVVIGCSEPGETSRILGARLETYSSGAHLSEIVGGGSKHHPLTYTEETRHRFYFKMDGKGVFKLSAQLLPDFVAKVMAESKTTLDAMKWVIPHQASLPAMKLMEKRLGVTGRFYMHAQRHGNTIAASIPLGLHEAISRGEVQRGDHLLLLGTSAGLSLGGLVLEY